MGIANQTDLKNLLDLCRADLRGRAFPSNDEGWSRLMASALNHGLVGLVYRVAATSNCISPVALLPIRSVAHQQSARSCSLVNELLEILAAFRDLNIEALTFKGPTLAMRAYGRISDREFCDLDVLIQPDELDRASVALHRRRYRIAPKRCTIEAFDPEQEYHAIFCRNDDGAKVELHWSLNSPGERAPIGGADVWQRARPVFLADQPVLTLGIEDTLLFLCVHAFKHRWERLKWLTDIAYLLRSGEQIDWEALILRSRQTGCYRMLLVGLNLAFSLLGCDPPLAIEKQVSADRVARRLADRIGSALLSDTTITGGEEIIYHLEARERFRDHFVLVFDLLLRIFRLTSEDELPADRPLWTRFIAVFKRPARLFRTFGLAWIKPMFRFR